MKIKDLAKQDGSAGSNGAWRSVSFIDIEGNPRRSIFHYSTLMLQYTSAPDIDGPCSWDGSTSTVFTSTGHGSVSDQGGMNQLFRALDMPFYFSRAGGATIR